MKEKYLKLVNLDDRNFSNNLFKDEKELDLYLELEEDFYNNFTLKSLQSERIYTINNYTYILHLSATKEKKWRVTTLNNNIPTCHTEFENYLKAIQYLISEIGYKNFLENFKF